jgi:hypothetical protein
MDFNASKYYNERYASPRIPSIFSKKSSASSRIHGLSFPVPPPPPPPPSSTKEKEKRVHGGFPCLHILMSSMKILNR